MRKTVEIKNTVALLAIIKINVVDDAADPYLLILGTDSKCNVDSFAVITEKLLHQSVCCMAVRHGIAQHLG